MKSLFALLALAFAGCTSAAGQCFLTFNPAAVNATPAGGDAQFTVVPSTTPCQRTAVSNNPDWLTVSFGQSSNGGTSTVGYTVKPNTTGQVRTGSIVVNTAASTTRFQVTQAANVCTFTLTPATQSVNVTGGTFSVKIDTACDWNATASVPWITFTSDTNVTGNGRLTYTVAANPNFGTRVGFINIGNQQLQVSQFGTVCVFAISPVTGSVPAAGGMGQISVQTDASCAWSASSVTPWLTFSTGSGTGPGTATYVAVANPTPVSRVAGVIVGGQNATINQAGTGINFISGSVVNAASFAAGAIAPGEIITIFGTGLGPAAGATLQLTADGQFVTTSLGGTRVLFDGVAAPMIYASDTQLSAIVPYALANASTTQVAVEVEGVRSSPATLAVKAASPAIFTIPARGTGQGAILNQDFSVNSADNPAAPGSVIQIFATGEGQTLPVGFDGKLAISPAPQAQTVTASIDGVPAQVLYAGGAPGLVAGVLQVNVVVPTPSRRPASLSLVLTIGGIASLNGVTVAIR